MKNFGLIMESWRGFKKVLNERTMSRDEIGGSFPEFRNNVEAMVFVIVYNFMLVFKHNKWNYGLEVVQRRQALDFNDEEATAEKIGVSTLNEFSKNINESFQKYETNETQEIICVHGYDYTKNFYLLSIFWKEYKHLDPNKIEWKKEGYGVSGYINENNISYKIAERINGNAKREATCFKEYKNVTKYEHSVTLKVPIPNPWPFDKNTTLAEINLKEKNHVPILFSE